jgi:hypothetical protein
MISIKKKLENLVGDCAMGWLDFFRYPYMKYDWGGPFNGQKWRQRIFFDLLYSSDIKAIVETGTFHGTTTALMAATTLPVYTVELQKRNYCYAKMRFLLNRNNIHLFHGDSRSFLDDLSKNSAVPKEDVFFYLDAHWGKDLPLREELEIIFTKWRNPIVMVDDFEVPDSEYGFDDYGQGKSLNLSYIEPVVLSHKLCVLFPAVTSVAETGAKRGCVILCQEDSYKRMTTEITTAFRYKPDH